MSLKHSSASVCLVLFVLGCSTASSQDCDPDCAGKNCGPDGMLHSQELLDSNAFCQDVAGVVAVALAARFVKTMEPVAYPIAQTFVPLLLLFSMMSL